MKKQKSPGPKEPAAETTTVPFALKSLATSTELLESHKKLKYSGNFHFKEQLRSDRIPELKGTRVSSEEPSTPFLSISKYNANLLKRQLLAVGRKRKINARALQRSKIEEPSIKISVRAPVPRVNESSLGHQLNPL